MYIIPNNNFIAEDLQTLYLIELKQCYVIPTNKQLLEDFVFGQLHQKDVVVSEFILKSFFFLCVTTHGVTLAVNMNSLSLDYQKTLI